MRSLQDIRLGIVCPMANEIDSAEQFVQQVISQCQRFNFKEILFFAILDKVSTDGTIEALRLVEKKLPSLQVVYASENRCVVDAYMRGYKEALQAECDWILEIDAGFSHSPNDIPLFLETMSTGYDCVFGTRFAKGGSIKDSSTIRYCLSKGGTMLTNLLIGTKLSDMTSGFELFSRQALTSILQKGIHSRGPFFQTEIKTFAHRYNIIDVPIQYRSASHQVGKKAIQDAWSNLMRLVKLRWQGKLA